MKAVRADYSNITYTGEGCFDLPATILGNPQTGGEDVETIWELSDEELEQVIKNRRVYLYIMGTRVPPVLITTESMRIDPNEEKEE